MMIARRVLVATIGARDHEVPVEIEAPAEQDGAWFCRYRIGWPEGLREEAGWGVDAVQALRRSLQRIGMELYASAYHRSGTLRWTAPGQGYGFPVPPNGREDLIGEDRVFG